MFYIFESYSLDTDRRELRRRGDIVALQPQVFDLLQYLIINRDRVVSKDDMLEAVWGGRLVSESTLATRINAARTAVGDNGDQQRLIRTLPRKGVRFVGAVQEKARPQDEAAKSNAVVEPETHERTAALWSKVAPAERRQLTIASCELLVGATTGMDPEDLREIFEGYQKCVVETIRRHNGAVANVQGNTAVIYFGYPQAHEDDPERAVRAALELVATVATLKTRTPVQTRVGVATGLVVIGYLEGLGEGQERGIVGETPNLAARLQGIAEPNAVVIADDTRKLLGNVFELEDLGTKKTTGIAAPVRAWTALRPSSATGRFEAFHATGLTDLVGREEELELLLRRWSRAKAGTGQVVLLSGEAGIGKSRLTVALLEAIASEPHTRLRYFCSPQHTDSALYPIISQMQRAARFAHDDTTKTKLDRLDALLGQSFTSRQDASLFAEVLSLPNDGRYPVLGLVPQQRRQKTLEALSDQMQVLSRSNRVLMIFEDVHWIDPTSLEALSRIVDRLKTLSALLVITYRPDFEAPWIARPYITSLTLNRLGKSEIAAMIDRVTGNKAIPQSIRQDIIERTDGIPLFVEEMTKAVLEAESEDNGQKAGATVSSAALGVPASLQASLMARLDRLGPAKEIAQTGAAIGREFSHALVAAVSQKTNAETASALDRIVAAGLLFRQGEPPHATYLFKHALVQDAAHGTLLREPRRALHARIAEALESQFTEMAENQPELLALHCTEAGLIEKSARFFGKAGQRSLARSALVEAAEQFTRALDQVATLPSTPALRREEIKLQVALITPLFHIKGYAAPESKGAVERARRLIEQAEALGEPLEDPLLLFSVLYGLFIVNLMVFNGDICRELAGRFLALAEKQRTAVPLMIGHRVMGVSLVHMGKFEESRGHLDRAIALYNPVEHRALASRFGSDSGVTILGFRSLAVWCLGFPETALTDTERAIEDAREIDQAATLMLALCTATWAQIFCGNYSVASSFADELVALAGEKGAAGWKSMGILQQCDVLASTGKASVIVKKITAGITALRATGQTTYIPWRLSHLARAYADLGLFDDAWRSIDEAMKAVDVTKEGMFKAEIDRVAGEIALMLPKCDAAKAQVYFERALAVARQQQAKSWELRAAMSLARVWRDQGKVSKAHELLAPVYGWFTEGFDTRDLKEAKALLNELAA